MPLLRCVCLHNSRRPTPRQRRPDRAGDAERRRARGDGHAARGRRRARDHPQAAPHADGRQDSRGAGRTGSFSGNRVAGRHLSLLYIVVPGVVLGVCLPKLLGRHARCVDRVDEPGGQRNSSGFHRRLPAYAARSAGYSQVRGGHVQGRRAAHRRRLDHPGPAGRGSSRGHAAGRGVRRDGVVAGLRDHHAHLPDGRACEGGAEPSSAGEPRAPSPRPHCSRATCRHTPASSPAHQTPGAA